MPGTTRTLSRERLRAYLTAHTFGVAACDRIGAEAELTPLVIREGRLDLAATRQRTATLWNELTGRGGRDWQGGLLSREPGGQLEFSGPPATSPDEAAIAIDRASRALRDPARGQGIDLIAVGMHPLASADDVGLQTMTPRYRAMQAYFDRIGPYGRRMMRLTGSVQVNVDLGTESELRERWELAQRLSPVLTAAFAHSGIWCGRPAPVRNLRAEAWQHLDPARTGIPPRFLDDPAGSPIDHYLEFALDAPVMFIVQPDGGCEVPEPGVSFATWMTEGILVHGYPDLADWSVHLSTLFPDVRPRGHLEIRTIDAPGLAWVGVPVLLVGHALRIGEIRRALLERLRGYHEQLEMMCHRAVVWGIQDPLLGSLADDLFQIVRSHLGAPAETLLGVYAERYIQPRRSPGDELLEYMNPNESLDPETVLALEQDRLLVANPCWEPLTA